jgi:hypothetical protein
MWEPWGKVWVEGKKVAGVPTMKLETWRTDKRDHLHFVILDALEKLTIVDSEQRVRNNLQGVISLGTLFIWHVKKMDK